MRRENYCFDGATPIIYKESQDGDLIIESIKDAYSKHADDDIYVCTHLLDENEGSSKAVWKKARLCSTQTIKCVTLYFKPQEFVGTLESDNVVRVTPNHIFPVLTTNGYADTEAYLLQTGDNLIFERNRKYGEYETPLFDEEGNVSINDVLKEGSIHNIEYRHIVKAETEEIKETSFYGIVLSEDSESKYFMLCNSLITHDSSL